MNIGYILFDNKINIGNEFIYISSLEEYVDKTLPLLVIGYKLASSLFGEDNIDILYKNIIGTENIHWTVLKITDRDMHDKDIEDFIKICYLKKIKTIRTFDLDFIQESPNLIRRMVKKLLTVTDAISYLSDKDIAYIYTENCIFIVDLNLANYLNMNIEKIKNKIKDKSLVFLEGSEILIEYNNYMEIFDNNVKLIPFFYSISPHD